ncbi:MAG TPA: hypothetical protein EYP98_07390, partial [Planctomycetes bacterium]|nr:hypothetical protein [Planctomycetota bacterium]
QIASERTIPVIGNGDLLTWYEVKDRWQQSGVASVMLGRGALIKPWIFREITEQKAWEPTAKERLGVYHDFSVKLKEHFRDDEKGRERTMRFLPWHLDFFCRLCRREVGGIGKRAPTDADTDAVRGGLVTS